MIGFAFLSCLLCVEEPAAVTGIAPGACYNFNIYLFLSRKAFFIIKTFHLSSLSPSSAHPTLFSPLLWGNLWMCQLVLRAFPVRWSKREVIVGDGVLESEGEGFNQSVSQGCRDKHPHHTSRNVLAEVSGTFSERISDCERILWVDFYFWNFRCGGSVINFNNSKFCCGRN